MKYLTIIVPAYNVSDYIEECLNSMLVNPEIIPFLEIIAVNDGSKDDTLQKMQEIAKKYPDSVIVVDKENGGHGSGINKGITLASGQYLKVLDSDDWVDNKGLTELVDFIRNSQEMPDAIINPYEYVWQTDGHLELCAYTGLKVKQMISLKDLNQLDYSYALHSLTLRTDIYKNKNIPAIDEKISYDDVEYILYPVPYINTVYYIDTVIYKYRYGMEGQSVSFQNYIKRRNQHKQVIISLIHYYNDNTSLFSEEQKKYYFNRLVGMINHNVNLLCSLNDKIEGKKEMKEFIRECDGIDLRIVPNKKLQLLLKTNCNGYSVINWFFQKYRG